MPAPIRPTAPVTAATPATPPPALRTPPPTRFDPAYGPGAKYDYDLHVDPDAGTLTGHGSITITNTQDEPLSQVFLRAWPNAQHFTKAGAGSAVTAITVDGAPAAGATQDRTVVTVPFPSPLAKGQQAAVGFDLLVHAAKNHDRFGVDADGTALFGNALPTVAVRDARGWNLDPYVPFGEAFYSTSADWHVQLHAPDGVQLAHTGLERGPATAEGGGSSVLDVAAPNVRDFFVAAGRDLAPPLQDVVDGTRIRVFTTQRDAQVGARILATAKQHLAWMNHEFGAYDHPTLDVVGSRGFFAGGMEYPGATVVGTDQGGLDMSVSHENAHQWFYGMVGNNESTHPWLDESLTQFATQRFLAGTPGVVRSAETDAAQPHISAPMSDLARGATSFGTSGRYLGAIYEDGPRMLNRLRAELTPAVFDQGMRAYVEQHKHGVAEPKDFIDAMSTAAGRDLTGWFAEHRVHLDDPTPARDPNGPPADGAAA